jgi:hypothetical protein
MMSSMRVIALLWPGLLLAALGACGNSFEESNAPPPPPCNEDPWSCQAGQTCWVDPQDTYQCLNQGPGELGQDCMLTIGTPTCKAALFCAAGGMDTPKCVPFCDNTDPNRACPEGMVCQRLGLVDSNGNPVNGVVNVCLPQ